MYLWQKDHFSAEELALISQSPQTSNLEALTTLGVFYAYGRCGYKQSTADATLILNQAMAKKHAQAFYVYAGLVSQAFFKGEVDCNKSVAYLKKSAELGFDLAMTALGEYYLIGKGVKKSYRDAEKWLLKARNQSSIPGLKTLEKYYRELGYNEKANEIAEVIQTYKTCEPIYIH